MPEISGLEDLRDYGHHSQNVKELKQAAQKMNAGDEITIRYDEGAEVGRINITFEFYRE